jgi:hypothetical protein
VNEKRRVTGELGVPKKLPVQGGRARAVAIPISGLKPKQCRVFAQKRVAEALPEIVDRFVREAKQGSIAHAKALLGLSGIDKQTEASGQRRRGKGLADRLLSELRRGKPEVKPDRPAGD